MYEVLSWLVNGCVDGDYKSLLKEKNKTTSFLHAKPWIPGGEKSVFTVVIH